MGKSGESARKKGSREAIGRAIVVGPTAAATYSESCMIERAARALELSIHLFSTTLSLPGPRAIALYYNQPAPTTHFNVNIGCGITNSVVETSFLHMQAGGEDAPSTEFIQFNPNTFQRNNPLSAVFRSVVHRTTQLSRHYYTLTSHWQYLSQGHRRKKTGSKKARSYLQTRKSQLN